MLAHKNAILLHFDEPYDILYVTSSLENPHWYAKIAFHQELSILLPSHNFPVLPTIHFKFGKSGAIN